jgi:RNA-directed DNA polymerase
MEKHLFDELKKEYSFTTSRGSIDGSKFSVIRYADDFVIIHKNKEVITRAKELLIDWLAMRGLEVSQEKTKIVHSSEGFDFLGFNCRHYDNSGSSHWQKKNRTAKTERRAKLLIKPSKESIKSHYANISEKIDSMKSWKQEDVIKVLNPMMTGWANYYRGSVAKETFSKLDHLIWLKLRKWCIRRCGRKSPAQAIQLYYHEIGTRKWCFTSMKDGKPDKILNKYSDVKIQRHVMVKSGKSYFDGDTVYWASRLSKGYENIAPSKARLLKKQGGKCAYCHHLFKAEDLMESHHVKFKAKGGKDEYKNLVVMHRHCHDQYHSEEAIRLSRSGKFAGESKKAIIPKRLKATPVKTVSKISKTKDANKSLIVPKGVPLVVKGQEYRKRTLITSKGLIEEVIPIL